MDKCKFLRQKKQVLVNGEWVDTRSYRYIPYCDGGLQGITVRDSFPDEKLVVGLGHTIDFNTFRSKTIQLDGNGNGYLELESNDVIYYIDVVSNYLPRLNKGTFEINGCHVNSLGYNGGYVDGEVIHPDIEADTVIINCSTYYKLFAYSANFHFNGKNIIFNSFDTSDIGRMDCMFKLCSGITSLDLRSFNTSKVSFMDEMFADCINLTSLDVSSFDTSKVTNMESMFHGCNSLKSLNVSNFNTSNVSGMSEMFAGCESLTSLDVSNFNTSNVRYMVSMFIGCSGLTSLNLSNFNFSNVSSMQFMFVGCSSLESIDLSNWNLNYVKNFNQLFDGCTSLKTVYMRNCDIITIGRIKESIRDAHIQDQVTIIT